ncbi:DNA primase family protein [Flavobacterium hauense]
MGAELNMDSQILLQCLLDDIEKIDFRNYFEKSDEKIKLQKKHHLVPVIENLLEKSNKRKFSLCRKNEMIYLYNGEFWEHIEIDLFKDFLGEVAEKSGIDKYESKFYQFKDELLRQFMSAAGLEEIRPQNKTLINLKNGTFEISKHQQILRSFQKGDFLTYQLPFIYNPNATSPIFTNFLNEVLPHSELQNVLSEYLGYIFIKNSVLKLEKVLLIYGTGANGKSVLFEIVNALLGLENITSYSLQSLTERNGYSRAMIANKLLNYASEINGKLETSVFKQLSSGESVDARLPYGKPHNIKDYARLIFNCNELPSEVENTHAYFRRFLIIPFQTTIPPEKQDKELAQKIIENELSGVFNWIISGLNRLLENKKFTESDIIRKQVQQYQLESDSILMFLDDEEYITSTTETIAASTLYGHYKSYCFENGVIVKSMKIFSPQLEKIGFKKVKTRTGQIFYIQKRNIL